MKFTSYKTPCGGSIILTEGVREHLEAHPGILDLIPEIASKVSLPTDGSRLACQTSLGRAVGQSSLINTKKIGLSEMAWFAVRKNRMKASRVVPDAGPVDTDLVSIVANPVEKDSYELVTAWFGAMAPKEPWDPDLTDDPSAYEESINFWCRHALVHDLAVMDEPFESTWEDIVNDRKTIK
ncbi:uncharacterized protein METZ01_LOCUS305524 [marine metagenome]|uniref:Uncharacterized protein n=1 Tax=marine metagenome TaxID=408172 RepID=A0A382MVW4_9ZZZZ